MTKIYNFEHILDMLTKREEKKETKEDKIKTLDEYKYDRIRHKAPIISIVNGQVMHVKRTANPQTTEG